MSRRVLHKASLITEAVAAVLPHTMEMSLVLTITALRVLAVLIESAAQIGLEK